MISVVLFQRRPTEDGRCWVGCHLNFDVTVRTRRSKRWWWLDQLRGPHWPRPFVRPSVCRSPPSIIVNNAIVIIAGMRSNHSASAADVWWSVHERRWFIPPDSGAWPTDDDDDAINKIKQLKDSCCCAFRLWMMLSLLCVLQFQITF